MTREKIISLLRECGLLWLIDDLRIEKQLETFYKAAQAEVLEAAAKLMDARYAECLEPEIKEAAAAIREMAKENGKC